MWPPRACPIGFSKPHIGRRVFLVFLVTDPEESDDCSSVLLLNSFLWLARLPHKYWNDENSSIQVLHRKTRLSPPPPTHSPTLNRMRQLAAVSPIVRLRFWKCMIRWIFHLSQVCIYTEIDVYRYIYGILTVQGYTVEYTYPIVRILWYPN